MSVVEQADYVAGIDDSGGLEPLVDWAGDFNKGDHEITIVMAFFIRSHLLPEFEDEWNQLRAYIQSDLGAHALPPIHMRLMWGKSLPTKYRGSPNPYLHASFDQIQDYVARALTVIRNFTARPKDANWHGRLSPRNLLATSQAAYFKDPTSQKALQFLKDQSHGSRRKLFKHYHAKVTSPLLPLLISTICVLNEYMRLASKKTMRLVIDPATDSHGIDTGDVFESMTQVLDLPHIVSAQRIANSDRHPVCQAADLLAFIQFRNEMAAAGHIAVDEVLHPIWSKAVARQASFTVKDPFRLFENRVPDWGVRHITAHYALARHYLCERYPDFANEHLAPVDVVLERAREAERAGASGFPILADSILEGF